MSSLGGYQPIESIWLGWNLAGGRDFVESQLETAWLDVDTTNLHSILVSIASLIDAMRNPFRTRSECMTDLPCTISWSGKEHCRERPNVFVHLYVVSMSDVLLQGS